MTANMIDKTAKTTISMLLFNSKGSNNVVDKTKRDRPIIPNNRSISILNIEFCRFTPFLYIQRPLMMSPPILDSSIWLKKKPIQKQRNKFVK